MIEVKTDYEKVFQMFVGTDKLREDMWQPFKQGDRYYATDAYSAIMLPIEKAELPYLEQSRPGISAVVPQRPNCNMEIKVEDIERQLIPSMIDETETIETKTECKECDGEGVLECDLGHEHECSECEGEGQAITEITKPTGKKIVKESKLFRMLEVGFQYKQLRRLVDVCKMMEVETITKTFGTPNNANLFNCGEVKILIMPAIINGEEIGEFKPVEIIV